MNPEILTAIGALVAAIAGALTSGVAFRRERLAQPGGERRVAEETPAQRAERLTKALQEAAAVIDEFKQEIAQGEETAARLQADIDTYSEVVALRRSEVEAVARVLRGELAQESRRSFRRDIAIAVGSLVAGAGVSLLVTVLIGA
jgi:hypothetical protein